VENVALTSSIVRLGALNKKGGIYHDADMVMGTTDISNLRHNNINMLLLGSLDREYDGPVSKAYDVKRACRTRGAALGSPHLGADERATLSVFDTQIFTAGSVAAH
jgi:hypothetical protein